MSDYNVNTENIRQSLYNFFEYPKYIEMEIFNNAVLLEIG